MIDIQIKQLEQELDAIPAQKQAILEDLARNGGDSSLLVSLQVQAEVLLRRLGILKEDKAKIEQEKQWVILDELYQIGLDHDKQMKAWKAELEQLQARRDEILKQKTEAEAINHAPLYKRIRLMLELQKLDRQRVEQLNEKYQLNTWE